MGRDVSNSDSSRAVSSASARKGVGWMPESRGQSLAKQTVAIAFMLALACLEARRSHALEHSEHKALEVELVRQSGNALVRIQDQLFGSVVDVRDSQSKHGYLLEGAATLTGLGGTLSMWVRPSWSPSGKQSHTLVSANWGDDRKSYFAISQGWWEPLGADRLYFIASNQDIAHCSSRYQLPVLQWSLVTVTWKSMGADKFCRLYVDEDLIAESHSGPSPTMRSTALRIGSDFGVSEARDRSAAFQIKNLQVLDYSITQAAVRAIYKSDTTDAFRQDREWSWIGSQKDRADRNRVTGTKAATIAIFDEDMGWANSRFEISKRLDRVKRSGARIYVPVVWDGGMAAFPSSGRLPMRISGIPGFDPLAYLVESAHLRGIEVYPWIMVARRSAAIFPKWSQLGTPHQAFDVHDQSFRKFIVEIVVNVVRRYPVDGINLDYVRAMGVCLSASCKSDYLEATGESLETDYADGSPTPDARNRIARWQDSAVQDIVQSISTQAKEIRSSVALTVDGYVVDDAQRPLEGRNEVLWEQRGLVDGVFNMDYRRHLDVAKLRRGVEQFAQGRRLYPLIGNYDRIDGRAVPRSGVWLRSVVQFLNAEKVRPKIIGIYLYGQMTEGQIESLSDVNEWGY